MDPLGVYLIAFLAFCLFAIGTAVVGHRRTLGRWGGIRGPRLIPFCGGYREAAVATRTEEVVAHVRAPGTVLGAGIGARLWAALTLLVFAPLGAVAAVIMSQSHVLGGSLGALAVGVLVVSGLALALGLFVASHSIEQRENLDHARRVLRWSFAHHALVALTFAIIGFAIDDELGGMALLVVLPVCLVGMGITHALRNARHLALSVDGVV